MNYYLEYIIDRIDNNELSSDDLNNEGPIDTFNVLFIYVSSHIQKAFNEIVILLNEYSIRYDYYIFLSLDNTNNTYMIYFFCDKIINNEFLSKHYLFYNMPRTIYLPFHSSFSAYKLVDFNYKNKLYPFKIDIYEREFHEKGYVYLLKFIPNNKNKFTRNVYKIGKTSNWKQRENKYTYEYGTFKVLRLVHVFNITYIEYLLKKSFKHNYYTYKGIEWFCGAPSTEDVISTFDKITNGRNATSKCMYNVVYNCIMNMNNTHTDDDDDILNYLILTKKVLPFYINNNEKHTITFNKKRSNKSLMLYTLKGNRISCCSNATITYNSSVQNKIRNTEMIFDYHDKGDGCGEIQYYYY